VSTAKTKDFALAWAVLAGVTTAQLPAERQEEAKAAVRAKMWSDGDGPRHFINETKFVIGLDSSRQNRQGTE
jgi:hypothetical protein